MKKIILLSGLSGAGKSSFSNILEDLGFTCIDNYPISLIDNLISFLKENQNPIYDKIVITANLKDFADYYKRLKELNIKIEAILLYASKEILLNRYKFTRRIHPLIISNVSSSLEMAINLEYKQFDLLVEDGINSIDTSNLSVNNLKKIAAAYNEDERNLRISFSSFGFKYGIQKDADFVFDVRILDNPFYLKELKDKSGNDKEVYDYVIDKDNAKAYIKQIISLLDHIFKEYKTSKMHLNIAFACTGGKHRSVSMANYFYNHYKDKYECYIYHRDYLKGVKHD